MSFIDAQYKFRDQQGVTKMEKLAKQQEERVQELHRKCIFINTLQSPAFSDEWLIRLRDGGMTACNLCVSGAMEVETVQKAQTNMVAVYEAVSRNPDVLTIATKAAQIRKAKKENKLAICLGFQRPEPIGRDIGMLYAFHLMGLKILQITYQERNFVGDGCGERTNCGLSNFGIQLVEQMNKLGIVIDLAHVGSQTTLETIELSNDPVIFSHNGCRSVEDHHPANLRNKSDEELKLLAEKDGVIGIIAYSPYVKYEDVPTLEDFMKHLDRAVKIAGVDHVGIGLDGPSERQAFDPFALKYPELVPKIPATGKKYVHENIVVPELSKPEFMINITRALVLHGYSDDDIEKILGGNFLNLFEEVWK